jgi:hypothetical protein
MIVGVAIAAVVGLGVFAFIDTGSMLAARNLSVNLTSDSIRRSLDRVEQLIQQADEMPTLVNTSGLTTTGPAAGVRFFKFVGGPYVVNPGSTSLAASATSLTLRYSLSSASSAVATSEGDILRIDGTATSLKPRLGPLPHTESTPSPGMRDRAVPLTAALGTNVSVAASSVIRAKLIRDVGLIVMTTASGQELRYYPDFATTTNFNDPAKYVVVTDQIGLQSDDATPFSLVSMGGRQFVSMSLRVRASNFDRRLLGKQGDQFNTFSRVDSFICPKVNPSTN